MQQSDMGEDTLRFVVTEGDTIYQEPRGVANGVAVVAYGLRDSEAEKSALAVREEPGLEWFGNAGAAIAENSGVYLPGVNDEFGEDDGDLVQIPGGYKLMLMPPVGDVRDNQFPVTFAVRDRRVDCLLDLAQAASQFPKKPESISLESTDSILGYFDGIDRLVKASPGVEGDRLKLRLMRELEWVWASLGEKNRLGHLDKVMTEILGQPDHLDIGRTTLQGWTDWARDGTKGGMGELLGDVHGVFHYWAAELVVREVMKLVESELEPLVQTEEKKVYEGKVLTTLGPIFTRLTETIAADDRVTAAILFPLARELDRYGDGVAFWVNQGGFVAGAEVREYWSRWGLDLSDVQAESWVGEPPEDKFF